jgi:hypothetical protein
MYLLAFLLLQVSSVDMDSYHIIFERSGGFAGISQTLELKSDTMSVEDRDHLSKLIESSGFYNLKPESDTGLPDQFIYTLTIKSTGQEKTLTFGEGRIPNALRPLIDYFTAKLRRR